MRWVESRVEAARALAGLIINLPANQIVELTGYIAQRTHTGLDTVTTIVTAHLERTPPARPDGTSLAALDLRTRTCPPLRVPASAPTTPQITVRDHHPARRAR